MLSLQNGKQISKTPGKLHSAKNPQGTLLDRKKFVVKMGDSDDDMDYGGGEKRRDKFRSERGGSPPSRDSRGGGGRR